MSQLTSGPITQRGPRASFGQRLGAYLIDVILISIVEGIVWAIAGQAAAGAIGLVVALVYFTYFEGSESGQTLGKRALGIRVYDFSRGGRISFGRAFVRTIGKYISSLVCLLGFLWMLWDDEKQTWHDKIATTVVVPTSAYPTS